MRFGKEWPEVQGCAAEAEELLERASKEPLEVDISDYSDEFCAGFLAGQVNALEWLADRMRPTWEEER